MPTKSQEVAADIAALLRARNPLLWIVTREEARVEGYLAEAAAAASYEPVTWDIAAGVRGMDGKDVKGILTNLNDPGDAMAVIAERKGNRTVWIMRDLPVWLGGASGALTMRALRNLTRTLPSAVRADAQAVIVLSPSAEVPPELAGSATVIEWPMPDRAEIAALLESALDSLSEEVRAGAIKSEDEREAAIDAAVGLSGEEASSCFARSLVQTRRIDAALISGEKKRVIARERVLEWFDPLPGGMDSVGGLENLKEWLRVRRDAYSPAARDYGLPSPKGIMLVGVPGCGKSLTAKAIATAFGCPLLRVDLGALKSKFVGESEANLRKAFDVISAIGRCVVWFDEIEKALQGATSGAADGGVSSDALGAILSWMQERQGEAFVVATANDVSGLPPELLRKGRFDELFFVDLPNEGERAAILRAALRGFNRKVSDVDAEKVAKATEDFTGAEIAAIVPDAMFAAFEDGKRELTAVDLIAASTTVVPLAKTASEKITALRQWAKERARNATASINTIASGPSAGRTIDL